MTNATANLPPGLSEYGPEINGPLHRCESCRRPCADGESTCSRCQWLEDRGEES